MIYRNGSWKMKRNSGNSGEKSPNLKWWEFVKKALRIDQRGK